MNMPSDRTPGRARLLADAALIEAADTDILWSLLRTELIRLERDDWGELGHKQRRARTAFCSRLTAELYRRSRQQSLF